MTATREPSRCLISAPRAKNSASMSFQRTDPETGCANMLSSVFRCFFFHQKLAVLYNSTTCNAVSGYDAIFLDSTTPSVGAGNRRTSGDDYRRRVRGSTGSLSPGFYRPDDPRTCKPRAQKPGIRC